MTLEEFARRGQAAQAAVDAAIADATKPATVAACSGCGRGYIHIHHDGVSCMACGSPVRLLPTPEVANDDTSDRERWKVIVNHLPGR